VAVAAGHRQGDRDAALAQRREHAPVALEQPAALSFRPAEAVVLVRVGAGEIEREAERPRRVLAPDDASAASSAAR
jgi:hypothetical protein